MDLSEALVDLLLVRLGREEERQRVVDLLVNELRMTREQARKAVDSTPTVLMEAVPMGQARVIQNRLYPFVDLLPRMDSVPEETGQPEKPASEPVSEEPAKPSSGPSAIGISSGAGIDQKEANEAGRTMAAQGRKGRQQQQPPDVVAPPAKKKEPEELVVTSASEEVLTVERCHVCGRTPTGVEKLAPCRSCAEPTCRDCFDRVAHVCQKCASEGKVVDSPLSRTTRAPLQPIGGAAPAAIEPGEARKPNLLPAAGLVLVLAAAAVIVFVDPFGLHLLGPGSSTTVVPPDTSLVVRDSVRADTTTALPDTSTSADTALAGVIDPAGLAAMPLPEGIRSDGYESPVPCFSSGAPSSLSLMGDEALALQPGISSIAASVPIGIDRFSLFRAADSTIVFAFAILHPEEDTGRYDLLRKIAAWLEPSGIDEITFYYSENQYYPVRTVSFVHDNFQKLTEAMGPVDFQNIAGSSSEDVWTILTGPAQSWLAGY